MDFVQNRSRPQPPQDLWNSLDTFPRVKTFGTFGALLCILIHPIFLQKVSQNFWKKSKLKLHFFGGSSLSFVARGRRALDLLLVSFDDNKPRAKLLLGFITIQSFSYSLHQLFFIFSIKYYHTKITTKLHFYKYLIFLRRKY